VNQVVSQEHEVIEIQVSGIRQMSSPKLIVLSAPSGSGKTTIAREILRRHPELRFSVSATTRPKREYETDGKDYFFLTKEEFESKIQNNALAEWEQIYGNYYGTLRSEIDSALRSGTAMMFDIDVKGALSIKQQYPDDTILIFITPPSIEVLTERLHNRKTEDVATIRRRLERVPMEMAKAVEFDTSIVNDDLQKAISDVDAVIQGSINS
jgi:guanylate kinase